MSTLNMQETMDEIDRLESGAPLIINRERLLSDISILENDIKVAEEAVEASHDPSPIYSQTTPEQANKQKKDIVFLKKNLAQKKDQYEESA